MFSGVIGHVGWIERIEAERGGLSLTVRCEGVERERPEIKDSIAIDGVCLTVTALHDARVTFDVIPETLARSAFADRRVGDRVNVEYALRLGDRMGGHFVYGHVDASVRMLARAPEGQGERIRIERPPALAAALIEKAFVAVDGVSLTIAAAGEGWFEIALIPETLARTQFAARQLGSRLNLEVDPIARYAQAALEGLRGGHAS